MQTQIPQPDNNMTCTIPMRSYTQAELAQLYQIHRKTFRNWIKPIATKIGQRQGHFYNVKQVVTIFEFLGIPGLYVAQRIKIGTDRPTLTAIAS